MFYFQLANVMKCCQLVKGQHSSSREISVCIFVLSVSLNSPETTLCSLFSLFSEWLEKHLPSLTWCNYLIFFTWWYNWWLLKVNKYEHLCGFPKSTLFLSLLPKPEQKWTQEWGSCWRSSSVRRLSKFSLEFFVIEKRPWPRRCQFTKPWVLWLDCIAGTNIAGRERGIWSETSPKGFDPAHLSWCEGICFQPCFSKDVSFSISNFHGNSWRNTRFHDQCLDVPRS